MADDFYGYDDDGEEPKGRDNLFLWTVFILLLVGVALACWLGSFYIFGHPERPASYRFLKKIGKIESQVRFEVTDAPQGEFLTAKKLFERYGRMTPLELDEENALLLRSYIKNYRESRRKTIYVTGRYVILDAHGLLKSDFFPSGVVALAQAAEFPQVLIEHVYTTAERAVPASLPLLQTGREIKLEKTDDLAALLHIERLADGHMQFSVVPLLYPRYPGLITLDPPTALNIESGLPVIKKDAFVAGLNRFAEFRRTNPLAPATTAANSTPAAAPEIVRADPPAALVANVPPAPGPVKSTPHPVAPPPLNVTMLVTPVPRLAPTPNPTVATPLPAVSPTGVPLQPFIRAERDPNMPTAGGSWRVYAPGKAPPARTITPAEAGDLADRGELGDRIYLRGNFRVSASSDSRAVLRDRLDGVDSTGTGAARIIVEYPAGALPPTENATFVRDATAPYEIRSVRRGADGQVNIYVREIIQQ